MDKTQSNNVDEEQLEEIEEELKEEAEEEDEGKMKESGRSVFKLKEIIEKKAEKEDHNE